MTQLTSTTHTKTDVRKYSGLIRLKNINTGEYLHLSGQFATIDKNQSWSGTIQQANKLKQIAEGQGEEWSYSKVKADAKQGASNHHRRKAG